MQMNKNPLYFAQREKAGPETYKKYGYQYHWALYRVLSNHESLREYAVFVELHEDVVVADSLSADSAKFEFNQVKTNKGKFTAHKLVISKKKGSSVLGKLISSGQDKPFSNRIKELNLVALNDFSLELNKEKVQLNKITLTDLSKKQLKQLEVEIKKELNISSLPANLNFIVPALSENNYQNDVISTIANLIKSLSPSSFYDPVEVYKLLIDEVNKKGVVTYDFSQWDDLLKNKALTSITVTKVINEFTSLKDEGKIEAEFYSICNELNLKIIESKSLKRAFDRYRLLRVGNRSGSQLKTTKAITRLIDSIISKEVKDFLMLLDEVCRNLPKGVSEQFDSEIDVKAAIICEYIMQ